MEGIFVQIIMTFCQYNIDRKLNEMILSLWILNICINLVRSLK